MFHGGYRVVIDNNASDDATVIQVNKSVSSNCSSGSVPNKEILRKQSSLFVCGAK